MTAAIGTFELIVLDLCPDCPPVTLNIPILAEPLDERGVVRLAPDYGYVSRAVRAHVRQHVRE